MTTPIDELAGNGPYDAREEAAVRSFLEAFPRDVNANVIRRLLATLDAARSTPVPASNVSEGLREAVERYIVAMTRRASGGTTDAEVQAAYAALYDAAAPERLAGR